MGPHAVGLRRWSHDGSDAADRRAVSLAPSPAFPRFTQEDAFRPLAREAGEGRGEGLAACLHCNQPNPPGRRFCCPGCAAAFETIQALGLGRYYAQRVLDPTLRAPRPEPAERWDL